MCLSYNACISQPGHTYCGNCLNGLCAFGVKQECCIIVHMNQFSEGRLKNILNVVILCRQTVLWTTHTVYSSNMCQFISAGTLIWNICTIVVCMSIFLNLRRYFNSRTKIRWNVVIWKSEVTESLLKYGFIMNYCRGTLPKCYPEHKCLKRAMQYLPFQLSSPKPCPPGRVIFW